jgi:multidrug resistance efflux pump
MAQSENSANVAPGGPAPAGAAGPRPGGASPEGTRRGGRGVYVVLPLLLLALLAGAYYGYGYLQDRARHVSTDNALVTGALLQVGGLNAGQVTGVAVDIGDKVSKGQVLATVMLPASLGSTSGGTPKMGFLGTGDQQVSVASPIDGVVVARSANPGDTVAAGQSLLTLIDPTRLWVQAQIEETKVGRVVPGQPVEVTVDALQRRLPGRVVAVNRATAGTFSLMPQGNTSGNFTKVTQLVPVKIAVDYGQLPLVLGSSVEVKIRVQP